MNVVPETFVPPNDEISLLDIAVAVAESWKLLVFCPLVVGLSVLGLMQFAQPDRYASTALLRISQGEAALLESAGVVDPAIRETEWGVSRFGSVAAARRELLENGLTTEKLGEADYFRVSVAGDSPESARALLSALIAELIRNSAPRDNERDALGQKLRMLEQSARNMNQSLTRLNTLYDRAINGDSNTVPLLGDAGQSYATLISGIAETEQEILSTQLALEGSVSSSDVLQQPTLDGQPLPKRAMTAAALAAFATAIAVLLFAFARASLANAAQDARSAKKVRRIRRALTIGKVRRRAG